MKRFLLATAALTGLVSGAAAADLPSRAAPAFAPVPVFTWTGFYFGAHAGYLWSDADATLAAVGVNILPTDVANATLPRKVAIRQEGVLGGVQAGYNMQFGMFVAGVEADFSWADAKADALYSAPDRFLFERTPFAGATTNTAIRSDLEWLSTIRARFGVAVDRALFFVTGGAAAGDVRNSFSISIPSSPLPPGGYFSPTWSKRDTEWGWTLGGGVEYALAHNITLKAEYLYYDLRDHTIHGTDPSLPIFTGEFIDYKFKNNGNIARTGINFRF